MNDVQLGSLKRAVDRVQAAQEQIKHNQEVIHGTVVQVAAVQDATRNDLTSLRDRFEDFLRRDELNNNLQLAQTEIVAVRQELTTEYGHFGDVRRLATGTLQALDVGIVSNGTMRQLSEELMLTTPRYWLAPALVAIAAWIRDDETLARRALGEAVRRDNDKSSLFFALVLRRHQRNVATGRWLRQYVARQDPAALSREFTVVLDAVATGAFGLEAKPLVLAQLSEWYDKLVCDQAAVDRQVRRWQESIDGLRGRIDSRYTVLPKISPTWPVLKDLYEGATVHGIADARFRKMFAGPLPQSDDLHRKVDDILSGLVTNYDVEEAPLRYKEAGLQAVIDAAGDKAEAAKAMLREDPVHAETVDLLTLVSNAALYAEKAGVSPGTRRFAVVLAKKWIVQADGQLEARNLSTMPAAVELDLEGWQGRIDSRTSENQLVQGLAQHVDAETERAVAQVRFAGKPLAATIFAGIALVIAVIAAATNAVGFGVFMLLVAAACGGWAGYQAHSLPRIRADIRARGEQRRANAVAQLRGGIAEVVDFRAEWERELAKAAPFRQFMDQLNAEAHVAMAPDQRRGR